MALRISPRDTLDDMVVGEDWAYELVLTKEIGTKTVDSYTYKVYDSSDADVTDTFSGGSSISSGVITFGIKATATGKYTLIFIVACDEFLPDSVTQYQFYVEMFVSIT